MLQTSCLQQMRPIDETWTEAGDLVTSPREGRIQTAGWLRCVAHQRQAGQSEAHTVKKMLQVNLISSQSMPVLNSVAGLRSEEKQWLISRGSEEGVCLAESAPKSLVSEHNRMFKRKEIPGLPVCTFSHSVQQAKTVSASKIVHGSP